MRTDAPQRGEDQDPDDGGRNSLSVGVDRLEFFVGLTDPRRRDAAHGVDNCSELTDAGDAATDISEPLRHGAGPDERLSASAFTAASGAGAADARMAALRFEMSSSSCRVPSSSSPVVSTDRTAVGRLRFDGSAEAAPERRDGGDRQRVEQAGLDGQHQGDLFDEPKRRVLALVEDRANPGAACELVLHPRVRHAAETGEGLEL